NTIAELPAFVDTSRSFRGGMAAVTARKTELLEEALHPGEVLTLVLIYLGVRSLEVRVRQNCWRPMTRTRNEDCVEIVFINQVVEVNVGETLARVRAPMAEQPWLRLPHRKWLTQQRVFLEVQHSEAHIEAGAPVGVDLAQLLRGEGRPFDRRTGRTIRRYRRCLFVVKDGLRLSCDCGHGPHFL